MRNLLAGLILVAACAGIAVLQLNTEATSQESRTADALKATSPGKKPAELGDQPSEPVVGKRVGEEPAADACDPSTSTISGDPTPQHDREHVVVQVVDQDGEPRADVEVQLRHLASCGNATTDKEGLARLEFLSSNKLKQVTVLAKVLGRTEAAPSVEITIPQNVPTKLVLPPVGAINLKLVGPDGKPWPFITCTVCVAGSASIEVIGNGAKRFGCVHLGQKFTFRDGGGFPYFIKETTVTGPVSSGEEVQAQIVVSSRHPLLVGRLMAPDGHPVDSGVITFHRVIQREDGVFRGEADGHRANESGWFLVPLRESWSYRTLRLQWRVDGRIVACAEQPLDGPYPKTVHRLGTIRMTSASLLAAGKVRDASSHTLPDGIWVGLAAEDEEKVLDSRPELREPSMGLARAGKSISGPHHGGRYQVQTDADGGFEVRGPAPRSPFTIVAQGSRFAETRLTNVVPGTRDLDVPMQRFGSLKGRLLPPHLLYPWDFKLSILSASGRRLRTPRPDVQRNGRFVVRDVPPGQVCIAVHAPKEERPIRLVPNVEVRSGKTLTDDRLAPIDLRGLIETVTLRVVDTDGKPIPDAQVDAASSLVDDRPTNPRGEVGFPKQAAPLNCIVRRKGFRSRRITLSDSSEVALRRAIPLRIHVDHEAATNDQSLTLVRLSHEAIKDGSGRDATPTDVIQWMSRSRNFVDVFAEAPGKHTVTVSCPSPPGDDRQFRKVIEVVEKYERQEFRIRFDPKKGRAALEEK